MKIVKPIVIAATLSIISACGGGSTSSSSSETACIDATSTSGGANLSNTCDYAVNVTFLSNTFSVNIPGGESRFVSSSNTGVFFGACRAPQIPIVESSFEFSC